MGNATHKRWIIVFNRRRLEFFAIPTSDGSESAHDKAAQASRWRKFDLDENLEAFWTSPENPSNEKWGPETVNLLGYILTTNTGTESTIRRIEDGDMPTDLAIAGAVPRFRHVGFATPLSEKRPKFYGVVLTFLGLVATGLGGALTWSKTALDAAERLPKEKVALISTQISLLPSRVCDTYDGHAATLGLIVKSGIVVNNGGKDPVRIEKIRLRVWRCDTSTAAKAGTSKLPTGEEDPIYAVGEFEAPSGGDSPAQAVAGAGAKCTQVFHRSTNDGAIYLAGETLSIGSEVMDVVPSGLANSESGSLRYVAVAAIAYSKQGRFPWSGWKPSCPLVGDSCENLHWRMSTHHVVTKGDEWYAPSGKQPSCGAVPAAKL